MIVPSLVIFACLAGLSSALSGDLVVCLIAFAQGCFTWCQVVREPVMIDMAPKMAGTLFGVTDLFYSAGGFVVPLITSALVADYRDADEWRSVWILIIGFNVLYTIIYNALCKSDETEFSVNLERKRRPSEWGGLSSDEIDVLEKRMKKEHPHLHYNRRTSQVENMLMSPVILKSLPQTSE